MITGYTITKDKEKLKRGIERTVEFADYISDNVGTVINEYHWREALQILQEITDFTEDKDV